MVAQTDDRLTLKLCGTVPGLLDSTQPGRLLRQPDSELSFAAFDPRAASGPQDIPDLCTLSLNQELYRPKRVVIETLSSGESLWRFVPKARLEEGVSDEGKWPRVIEICGQPVECSQDQWDIYKLDPEYDCCVRQAPQVTVITSVPPKPKAAKLSPEENCTKRRMSTPEMAMPPPSARKKVEEPVLKFNSDEDEQDEVEQMIVDDEDIHGRAKFPGPRERAKKFREEVKKNRMERREKLTRRADKLGENVEESMLDLSANGARHSQSVPPENTVKRKASSLFSSLCSQDDSGYVQPPDEDILRKTSKYAHAKLYKRTRTVSPTSAKRDLAAKRMERERQKRERRERELQTWREARYQRFMEEVYAEVPTHANGTRVQNDEDVMTSGDSSDDSASDEDDGEDGEAARMAAIAESRRKLAELEADRPLWEEQARKREMRERTEQEAQQARAEQRRRAEAQKAEAERRRKAEIEEEIRRREEALRREREEIARREKEKRQRQQRWSYGPWTVKRALERYRILCETFDTTKFSPNEPLTIEIVPWPVLQSPISFTIEDVDWSAVEKFFEAVRHEMRPQDYAQLVEKSHRRFHPDRWRSRGLLRNVLDDAERGCLEVAANTVAQALTPLWRDITGR